MRRFAATGLKKRQRYRHTIHLKDNLELFKTTSKPKKMKTAGISPAVLLISYTSGTELLVFRSSGTGTSAVLDMFSPRISA